MTTLKTAIFPVAGLGTRFLPVTKSVPKELLPVHDRPLIEYAVEEARAAGITRFIFVNSPSKKALEEHFRVSPDLESDLEAKGKLDELQKVRRTILGDALAVVYQKQPLGLGHAVLCAASRLDDEAFAVLLPDDFLLCERPCLEQMVEAWHFTGGNMVATVDVGREAIANYGCLDVKHSVGQITIAKGMVEKPKPHDAPSTQAVVGRYILQRTVLERLAETSASAGGEIQLTDAIAADLVSSKLFGFEFEGQRFDCGQPSGFAQATIAISDRMHARLRMAA